MKIKLTSWRTDIKKGAAGAITTYSELAITSIFYGLIELEKKKQ